MVIDTNTVILVGSLFVNVVASALLLERTKTISDVGGRLDAIELYVSQIHTEVTVQRDGHPMDMMGGVGMFQTLDGKHTASSPEELLQKMMNDPESKMTQAEADELRNLFKDMTDADDDDESEPWKKR